MRLRGLSPALRLGVGLALSVAWLLAQALDEPWSIYGRLGAVAFMAVFACVVMIPERLRQLLAPKPREFAIGLGAGALMLALTYGGALLMLSLFPQLDGLRRELYGIAAVSDPIFERSLLLLVVLGEELVWRALLLDALRSRFAPLTAGAIAVGVYAVAQLGSGSWVVAILAVGCGALWTALCLWRDSLWPPLLAHVMWTFALLAVAPL